MAKFGWGLFGSLFALSDELNTRKQIRQHQPEAQKTIAQWQKNMDELKALQNKNYLADSDKAEIVSCIIYIDLTHTSANQIQISWDCNIPYNSIAKEFEIYKNFKNQSPQKIATLPFIKGTRSYKYTDIILSSEAPCISYSVYLCGIYNGTLIKSHSSTGGRLLPRLKKIELHVESRKNASAKLFWNRQDNVSTYKVYRSDTDQDAGNFELIVALTGEARRYTDHNVNPGKTYIYFIKAIVTQNGFLIDEKNSNEQNVTIEKQEKNIENQEGTPKTREKENNTSQKGKYPDFDHMDGHEFENFCATILKQNGFKNVSVTKCSGDQGIDILASKDGIKYGIQCKCYASEVGNKAVQEAFSGKTFYNRHVGVVLTNNYFTPSAKELAEKNGIILWDRKQLLKMIEFSSTQNI